MMLWASPSTIIKMLQKEVNNSKLESLTTIWKCLTVKMERLDHDVLLCIITRNSLV